LAIINIYLFIRPIKWVWKTVFWET